MGFMNWESKYELGIDEMDQQHQKWLEILNQFYDQLNGENINQKIVKMVDQVIDYTEFHFSEEEKFLDQLNYPMLGEQKEMHEQICETIKSFKQELEQEKMIISTRITRELKRWFTEHILHEDKKYADYYHSFYQ